MRQGISLASYLQYRFELDNGHMNDRQLEEKLVKHYTNIAGQIIFIMRHRERPHLEAERVLNILNISGQLFYRKPNKVFAACYSQFLENGKIYNRKVRNYRQADLWGKDTAPVGDEPEGKNYLKLLKRFCIRAHVILGTGYNQNLK